MAPPLQTEQETAHYPEGVKVEQWGDDWSVYVGPGAGLHLYETDALVVVDETIYPDEVALAEAIIDQTERGKVGEHAIMFGITGREAVACVEEILGDTLGGSPLAQYSLMELQDADTVCPAFVPTQTSSLMAPRK